jgi:ribonuclease P protein component
MQTFSKAERLCSKAAIDKVFESGKTISAFSFKLYWLANEREQEFPVQVLISVPKRNFKRAVDRNRLKRMIREAYRKNKNIIYDRATSAKYNVMLVFTGKTIIEYKELEEKIKQLLQRLAQELNL